MDRDNEFKGLREAMVLIFNYRDSFVTAFLETSNHPIFGLEVKV